MREGPREIASGLAFGESVRWHDGRVWYCDWVDGDVCSVLPDGSDRRVHAHVDGMPVCIDWRPDGTLVVVSGSTGEVLEDRPGSGLQPVADLSAISERPWNEIAVHPSGRMYVNGIGFDMMGGEAPSAGQIAVIDLDGSVRRVGGELAFPNGMAISEDGGTLIVAESHASRLTAYAIAATGDLEDRRVFAEVEGSAPDGICFAPDGSVWYASVPNRHCQRVASDGAVLETVAADRGCFSCALGPDGTLYIAATVWDADTFSTRRGVLLRAGERTAEGGG